MSDRERLGQQGKLMDNFHKTILYFSRLAKLNLYLTVKTVTEYLSNCLKARSTLKISISKERVWGREEERFIGYLLLFFDSII